MLRVVSANVNGVRAAARRGGLASLAALDADVLCLQEVRATDAQLAEALAGTRLAGYAVAHTEAATLGRAGVAILTRSAPTAVRYGVGRREFATAGRWVEVDLETRGRSADGGVVLCADGRCGDAAAGPEVPVPGRDEPADGHAAAVGRDRCAGSPS